MIVAHFAATGFESDRWSSLTPKEQRCHAREYLAEKYRPTHAHSPPHLHILNVEPQCLLSWGLVT